MEFFSAMKQEGVIREPSKNKSSEPKAKKDEL
jgi:hypothetical protein